MRSPRKSWTLIRFGSPVSRSWWWRNSFSAFVAALLKTTASGNASSGTIQSWNSTLASTMGDNAYSAACVSMWNGRSLANCRTTPRPWARAIAVLTSSWFNKKLTATATINAGSWRIDIDAGAPWCSGPSATSVAPMAEAHIAVWAALKAIFIGVLRTVKLPMMDAKTCTTTALGTPNPSMIAKRNVVDVSMEMRSCWCQTSTWRTSPNTTSTASIQNAGSLHVLPRLRKRSAYTDAMPKPVMLTSVM